ncbi:MAG: prepilin-type cleavage/methylation domain-containing protein [Sulfurospirillum sp.]
MIELIFVIVILGILAAVAIPRLAATRDDAAVSAATADISTLYTDLASYYTAQGQFADSQAAMALTAASVRAMSNVGGALQLAANQIEFRTDNNNTRCLTLTLTTDGNVTTARTNNPAGTVCTQLFTIPAIANLVDNNQTFGGRRIQR